MRRRKLVALLWSFVLALTPGAIAAELEASPPVSAPPSSVSASTADSVRAELERQYQVFIDAKRRKDDQALARVLMPSVLLIKQRNMAGPESGSGAYTSHDLLIQGRWHVIAEFRREWVPAALRLVNTTVSLTGDKVTVNASATGAGFMPINFYPRKEEREQVLREERTPERGSSFSNDLCFIYIWHWEDTWIHTADGWKLQVIHHHLAAQIH